VAHEDYEYVDHDDDFDYSSEEEWEESGLARSSSMGFRDKLPSLRASAEAEEIEESLDERLD